MLFLASFTVYSQLADTQLKISEEKEFSITSKNPKTKLSYADSLNKKLVTKKSISALFLSFGGGIAVPLSPFKDNSDVTFGILGRLEFASTSIFPFVISGEVDYFSFNGADEFKTTNLLNSYKTKILSVGLNIEYSLTKLIRSSFTMPFLTVDVKNNIIKREYDDTRTLTDLPREETKISVGAGVGFTVFILDFYVKYNHMKNNSFIGVYTKTKIPVIKF
jgi:hypothetical protein